MYVLSESEHLMLHEKADKHARLLLCETNGKACDGEEYCEAFYDFVADLVSRRFDPAHESGASLETYVERALETHRIEVKKLWLTHDARNVSMDAEVKVKGEGEGGGEATIGDTIEDEPHLDRRLSLALFIEVCQNLSPEEIDQVWALAIADGDVDAALELLAAHGRHYGRSTFYAKTVPALKEKVLWLIKR